MTRTPEEDSSDSAARRLLAATLLALGSWYLLFLAAGPTLALNHDELNFLHEGLRLPAQGRFDSYARGPLLYEMVAVLEVGWYCILRVLGRVSTPDQFLAHVLANVDAHLVACRALGAVAGLVLVGQVYRLGRLYGGAWVGALASLLLATNLTFIAFSSMYKEEPLFWLLLVTACIEAWRAAKEGRARSAVFAGAAVGAAFVAKLLGIFGVALFALPLLCAERGDRRRALRLAGLMAMAAGITVLALHPFLLTDTTRVFETVRRLGQQTGVWPGLQGLTLPVYLFTHLPNLIGWPVMLAGVAEFGFRLVREPRGPVMLAGVPILLLLFLGLRPGHSMAHYLFPVALFLIVFAASLAVRCARRLWPGRSPAASLAVIAAVALFGGAYLRGSAKHMLILTAPDTRLLARDYIVANAEPGATILVTHAIVGNNFWGPPLLPVEMPEGTGPFALARRQVLQEAEGPRYRLRIVDGSPAFTQELVRGCDWIVVPEFTHSPPELGAKPARSEPPPDFQVAAVLRPTPERRAFLFPYYTSVDFEALSDLSLASLWRERAVGWTLTIYRRTPGYDVGQLAPRRPAS